MSKRSGLLESIAETIADYREGEIETPTPDHVDMWIKQFEKTVQESMLAELDHVFKQTYISKETVKEFLSHLVKNTKLAGEDPCTFWKSVKFLNIQAGGSSQHEMLEMFDETLQEECGLEIDECAEDPETYLYLDDGIFSGNRIRNDLITWIESDVPPKANVHVVVLACHRGGQYYASTSIRKGARKANKQINISWWRCAAIEDRKTYINTSEVLRPERCLKNPDIVLSCDELGKWAIAMSFRPKQVETYWNSNS